jgi:hypothetical protein
MTESQKLREKVKTILSKYGFQDLLNCYSDEQINTLIKSHVKPNTEYTLEQCIAQTMEILSFDISCFVKKEDIGELFDIFIEWRKQNIST